VHGEANVTQPLLSHLRVAAGNGGDGLLHVSEIDQMKTRADLIVLTACETVNSKLFAGDGALSVARAFINAGADAVVATQWSVGESAAELSASFYQVLKTTDAASSLRAAKLQMRKRPGSNPLSWAPFVLIVN
jgi:CHAT domain-containing protein